MTILMNTEVLSSMYHREVFWAHYNLVPWLRYSFSDISLSVCLFMSVYMMLVALSMCLRVGAGIVGGSQVFQ